MNVEAAIEEAMQEVPGAVAAGVAEIVEIVDFVRGLMLWRKTVDRYPQAVLDVLAPATQAMFEGEMASAIEQRFKRACGLETDGRYFREILISSKHLWHYFGRIQFNPKVGLAVVTRAMRT